jgi:hypothetical protein
MDTLNGATALVAWVATHRLATVMATVTALAILAAATAIWRKPAARRQVLLALSFAASTVVSAYGWRDVGTQRLHLGPDVAWFLFIVFEVAWAISLTLANDQYRATTRRDPDTGEITRKGHPGKHGYAVWVLAGVSAVVLMPSTPPAPSRSPSASPSPSRSFWSAGTS